MVSEFDDFDSTQCEEPIRQETIDLLRAEVAQLEQELADRDAKIAELSATAEAGDGAAEPAVTEPETLALVARLEQLLDELDQKEQREASLQEMLRAAEEANEAEREERAQIESWLGEIEQRVGERETEWQAANEALKLRISELTTERDRAERSLSRSGHGSGSDLSDPSADLIADLRTQIHDLQKQLHEKDRLHAETKERLHAESKERLNHSSHPLREAAASHPAAQDATLREERLQLARDRAELARQRAELEHTRIGAGRVPDEVDQRVQALRQHLREIQVREEQDRKERQERTLAGRIARLWKRLEAPA